MWSIEVQRELRIPPSAIWERYLDAASWSDWAHNTRSAALDGPLEVGTTGRIQPEQGPEQLIRITRLEPERILETEVRPPGARMSFRYELEPTPGGVRVRHRIEMSGVLSPIYGLLIRKRNTRQLPEEIDRLAALVGTDR